MNNRVYFVRSTCYFNVQKFQYIHFPPEIFIRNFPCTLLPYNSTQKCALVGAFNYERVFSTRNFSLTQIILLQMIEQTILQLIVKSSLRYVIVIYKNVTEREHCQFWVE